ncbi:MAG TPA: ATP-binding protein [Patescibacteria group bacterium]|nr:ATP-binding protein [Patescibacteria group bacterium]
MANKQEGQLTVPADMRFAGLALELVREVTAPAQLSDNQIKRLEQAVTAAFANAVQHAYEPDEDGAVTVGVNLTAKTVSIAVRDGGIPFDASLERLGESAAVGGNGVPTGLPLIRSVMDEVQWVSLGIAGKELRMMLTLAGDQQEAEDQENRVWVKKNKPPAPPQTYTVRRLQPEDAVGVARCFYDAYGYSYPSTYFYDPQKILELNQAGSLISVVMISDLTGEVVGHCSAQRYGAGINAECGQIVIVHAHQGRDFIPRFAEAIARESFQAGVRRLISHDVSSHPVTQRATRSNGYNPVALALGTMPATLSFKKMNDALTQRESCVVSMRFLTPPEGVVVYAPLQHRDMLERIYGFIGRPVTFQSLPLPDGPGETTVSLNRSWGIADIQVRRSGTDTAADVRQRLRDLIEIGDAQVVYLELPLDQGGLDDICRAAETEGFFFAGLGNSSVTDGESLFLQYLNTEIDLNHLRIATPKGKEILNYVAGERRRLSR